LSLECDKGLSRIRKKKTDARKNLFIARVSGGLLKVGHLK